MTSPCCPGSRAPGGEGFLRAFDGIGRADSGASLTGQDAPPAFLPPSLTAVAVTPPPARGGTMTTTATSSPPSWIRPEDARLSDLLEVLAARTDLADYPHASRVEQEVLVYDWATLRHMAADDAGRRDVQ